MGLQKAFTLIEVMIVVVIVGIMSCYGMVSFSKQWEGNKVRKATENLRLIYNMQKRYKLENSQYYTNACAAAGAAVAGINDKLGLLIRDNDFSYTLTGQCTNSVATGYTIEAKRSSGQCQDSTLTLGHGGGDPVVSNCWE